MPDHSSPSISKEEYASITLFAAVVSVAALIFYYRQNSLLLYGDAVAHINIARRVFDSRTPGYLQLGTVWLPLPHVLDIPFVVNNWLWRTGIGAAIPSMISFVAGAVGIFRLVRCLAASWCAWLAVAIYALNPNLIYMQATGMTESLYLALVVWTVVYFLEFAIFSDEGYLDPARAALQKCALVLSAAMMTRYDAWFVAVLVIGLGILFMSTQYGQFRVPVVARDDPRKAIAMTYGLTMNAQKAGRLFKLLRRSALAFVLLPLLTALLWLAYNYHAYGNALEFANGPYSARAIQEHSRTPTMQTYPGEHSTRTAALYFLKVSRLTLGDGGSEKWLMALGFTGLLCWIFFERRWLAVLLLWTPAVFYTLCIAWGSVPIYVPNWWPFSYYNVRYGLQMLPAVAVGCGLLAAFLGKYLSKKWIIAGTATVLVWSYASVWGARPIVLREATANGLTRMKFEQRLAFELKKLPLSSTFMMDCGAYSGAVQAAGIPFRRVLRESNPPYWEEALTQPARAAQYVIAINNDAVAQAIRKYPQDLEAVAEVGTPGGPQATIYKSTRR